MVKDRGTVSMLGALGRHEAGPGLKAHSAGDVLNDRRWDLGSGPKAPNGLEEFELNQQGHLGRQRASNGRCPGALYVARAEKRFCRNKTLLVG